MTGFDLARERLTGVRVVSHQETPGIGSKVTEEQFTRRFADVGFDTQFATAADGGDVEAITGATYSSRAVCEAVRKSVELFPEIRQQVAGP
jgi:electron transport complex protein RnfG